MAAISESIIDIHSPPMMRWSSIFGGWLIATGIGSVLFLGGLALGFTIFDPNNAHNVAGFGIGTRVWVILTGGISLFLGGMFASWFDGRSDTTIGTLHGVCVWGFSITLSGLLLTVGASQFVHVGAAIFHCGDNMEAWGHPDHRGMGDAFPETFAELQGSLMRNIAQHSGDMTSMPFARGSVRTQGTSLTVPVIARGNSEPGHGEMHHNYSMEPVAAMAIMHALIKGNNDDAKALLAANTTMSDSEIDQTLQNISPVVDKTKANLKAAADAMARYSAQVMWTMVVSCLFSLLAAAIGGYLGAAHIHRVHHLRRYDNSFTNI